MRTRKKRNAGRGAVRWGPIPFEIKLRAVKLYLEEGHTREMVAEEVGGRQEHAAWGAEPSPE